MDFVVDSYGDESCGDESFTPTCPGFGKFTTDSDEEETENFLEDKSDTDDDLDISDENESCASNSETNTNTNNIVETTLEKEEKKKVHPLDHLFDEEEILKPKSTTENLLGGLPSKIESIKKGKNDKDADKPLSLKLYDGLTNKSKKRILPLLKNTDRKVELDKLLAKSKLLNSNWEEPNYNRDPPISKRKAKKLRKEEREKTKGPMWYGLPATEVTDDVKKQLEIMQMRSVLDPKHFYKKNHMKVIPKYFHIGKVVDSPLDYYNNRSTKKESKKSLVDQLLSDAEFKQYNKKKYAEILKEKKKTDYKLWKQGSRMNKKQK